MLEATMGINRVARIESDEFVCCCQEFIRRLILIDITLYYSCNYIGCHG